MRWIVVADAARARIFAQVSRHADLEELHVLVHPESRLHAGDLRTGGEGEGIESLGRSTHQSDKSVIPGEQHAESFARELTRFLRTERLDHSYAKLVIVAEPAFLGRIRGNLDRATSSLVVDEIDKNWTARTPAEIGQLIRR